MREAFAKTLTTLAASQTDLVLLAGDIGNHMFDRFKDTAPSRFYNCGVAEAGMTGLAAGLAACGLQPVTYSITPFNTLRCLEQIRNDICYPNLPVILVGTGSGLSYAELGPSHHSLDDIAALRILPNLQVICPGDPLEVSLALGAAVASRRPTYLRLGKKGEPAVHASPPAFEIGRGIELRTGQDVALLGVGNLLPVAAAAADQLADSGISTTLISLHTVKPLDDEQLNQVFDCHQRVAVVEEHGLAGGAGSAILEWGERAHADLRKLRRFGLPDRFLSGCGKQDQARAQFGLTPDAIAAQLLAELRA